MAGFFARVLLDQAGLPDAAAITESMCRRHPGLRVEQSAPSPNLIQPGNDVQVIRVGEQMVIVSLIRRPSRPNRLVWAHALRTWPDVLDAAKSHQAHLLVSTIGTQPAEPLSHARAITATVGSILDILPSASVVVWAGTGARPVATWQRDSLASFAPSPAFPLLLWIDILPFQTFSHDIVVHSSGLMIFRKFDIQMAEGSSTRADVVHKVARQAAHAISRNDTSSVFSAQGISAAELIRFSDAWSKRIDALACLKPAPLGQGPLPRLPRVKASRGQQKPPAIFVIASRNADKAPDIEFENLDVLLAGSPYLRPPEGKRGFPAYTEIPRLIIGKRKDRRPPRDLEEYHDYWLVSDQLKAIFEAIDPDAFAFQRCDVRQHDGSVGPQSWLCDVVRTLDAIDEETAKIIDHYFERLGARGSNVVMREELSFQRSRIGDAHISRTPYCRTKVFCDQRVKDACGVSGCRVRFEKTFE